MSRDAIKHAWGELEEVFIHRGSDKEWIAAAAKLWKAIDKALEKERPA